MMLIYSKCQSKNNKNNYQYNNNNQNFNNTNKLINKIIF